MWIVGLLVIIAAYEGVKEGWKVLREDYRKSRDKKVAKGPKGKRKTSSSASHAFGYWLAEGTRGFPQFRHGAAKGYHDARTKQHHANRDRERSAADHAEAHRDASREMYHERTRRNRARRDMRDMAIPAVDDDTPPLRAVDQGAPDGEDAPVTDWPPMRIVEPQRPDFTPATPSGDAGQSADDNGQPAPKEGSPPVADTNYDEVLRQAREVAEQSEQHAQAIKDARQKAEQMADESQAMDVDSSTLSEMMDLCDRLRNAEKAMGDVQESASALPDSVAKRHGLLADAHKSAPVPAAQREWYQE